MSLSGRFNHLFVLAWCLACSPAIAAVQDQIEPNSRIVTSRIRLDERSMILVPVRINGSGPYEFMLDTGCAKTIVDRKLAGELGLPTLGKRTVVGVLASSELSVVHVNALSVDGATVLGGDVFSTDHAGTVTGKVRGVLGEDFLRNFDLLIDYHHQIVRLESAPGIMAETAVGEHLPLQFTRNRLVITGHIREFGDATKSLLLDSGTNEVTLFKEDFGAGEKQVVPILAASFNQWGVSSATARRIHSLNLGNSSVSDLIVISLSRRTDFDADGLLPTSLFHSIFISHAGRFVILNPSFPKTGRDAPKTLTAR